MNWIASWVKASVIVVSFPFALAADCVFMSNRYVNQWMTWFVPEEFFVR